MSFMKRAQEAAEAAKSKAQEAATAATRTANDPGTQEKINKSLSGASQGRARPSGWPGAGSTRSSSGSTRDARRARSSGPRRSRR